MPHLTPQNLMGFQPHDHNACVQNSLAEVEARCAEKGLRFTPIRKRVLQILLQEHRALGAYDILDVLQNEGAAAQPPVAYRALDFLVTHGFAHKLEKRSAFVACTDPGSAHLPMFLICRKCDAVAESRFHEAGHLLDKSAQASGFAIERTVLEAEGICPKCQHEDASL